SEFVGREYDATVIWELGEPTTDGQGRKRRYVNDRIVAERVAGTPRPTQINPEAESRKAIQWVAQLEETGEPFEAAPKELPWDTTADPEGVVTPDAPTTTEAGEDPNIHGYRAVAQMGGKEGDEARAALIQAGIDPDGPVDIKLLPNHIAPKWKQHLS